MVHLLTLLAAAGVLVRANRGQWFFGDEWEFIVSRNIGSDPWRSLFAPHNEHWSTIPVLAWRGLQNVVGLHSYLPYVAVLILTHLALAHLLWRAMLRSGGAQWVATGLAAVFAVLGAGAENLLWAFQIGFIGSVLFGYLAVFRADSDELGRDRILVTWLFCVAALMCSGIGVVMVGVVALLVLKRQGIAAAAVVASVPAMAFVTWYLLIGGDGPSGVPKSWQGLLTIPDYAASGLTQSLERVVGLPASGALLLVAILGWLILRSSSRSIPAVAVATAVGSFALYAFIAPGREALGIDVAGGPRYTYICIALLLPSCALLLTDLCARTRWPSLLAGAVAVVLVWHNVYLLRNNSGADAAREAAIRRQVLAAADIAASESWLRNRPEPVLDPDITMEWLREARADGLLDEDEGLYTLQDELDVRARTQVALLSPGTVELPAATLLGSTQVEAEPQGECTSYTPTGSEPQLVLGVDPTTGTSIRLVRSSPGDVRVHLASSGAPNRQSEPAVHEAGASPDGVTLTVIAAVDRMILALPPRATTLVCNVVAPTQLEGG